MIQPEAFEQAKFPTLEQLARGCRIAQIMWMRSPTPEARIIVTHAEKLLDSALDQLASLRGSGLVGEEAA